MENLLPEVRKAEAMRILIVTDPQLVEIGLTRNVTVPLEEEGFDITLYTEVVPEPPLSVGERNYEAAHVYGKLEIMEDSEEIEVVLADRKEVARILKEERVALLCAYMMMHFLHDEEPFAFLHAKEK